MSDSAWIVSLVVGLIAGAGTAAVVTQALLRRAFDTRLNTVMAEAERQRAQAQRDQAQRAERELASQRTVIATQKADIARLEAHLAQACDELERLRMLVAASEPNTEHDSPTGYAATMPMPMSDAGNSGRD